MTGVTSCPPTQFETKIMATRCLETEAGFLKFPDISSYLKICAYIKKITSAVTTDHKENIHETKIHHI